jgi:hypothetical protein
MPFYIPMWPARIHRSRGGPDAGKTGSPAARVAAAVESGQLPGGTRGTGFRDLRRQIGLDRSAPNQYAGCAPGPWRLSSCLLGERRPSASERFPAWEWRGVVLSAAADGHHRGCAHSRPSLNAGWAHGL